MLLDIYEELQKGRSFSEAIATKPGVFPSLFVSMVGAGEASGNLDTIMNRVSEHYAKDSKTQNKIKGAMIYPIVLLVLLVGIMMVDCIEKSVGTLGNTYIIKQFEDVVENVKRGESLSVAMGRINVFDGMFVSIVYVGEESGTLDTILAKSSDYYDDEADSAISRLVGLMEYGQYLKGNEN